MSEWRSRNRASDPSSRDGKWTAPVLEETTYPAPRRQEDARLKEALAASVGATEAWLPTFDSPAWVSSLQFTRDQVDAGIEPFTEHQFGPAFADRRR